MARYVDAIDLPLPVEEAFAYFADFSRVAEWDPGVVEARALCAGAPALGSRFQVVVGFLGRRATLEYTITTFEPGQRLVLTGGDTLIESIDEISFVPRAGGTRVTYEARLALRGVARLADPLLDVLFQRVGRLAVRGLRERIASGQLDRRDPPAQTDPVRSRDARARSQSWEDSSGDGTRTPRLASAAADAS